MTRIIAGQARGRRLSVPTSGTRPTSDRVRESLFAALESARGPWVGARVLDLFAGSGALGLEALSRGAAHARLVERDRGALAVLARNVKTLGLAGAQVQAGDVTRLAQTPAPAQPYDLVLADPPYELAAAELVQVLAALATAGWLAPDAIVVLERGRRDGEFDWPSGFAAQRERRYGDTVLHTGFWYGHQPRHPAGQQPGPAPGHD